MPRPRKRVILFILEGPSDYAALARPIQTFLQGGKTEIEPAFLVAEQDVTSFSKNNPDNIIKAINKWHFDPFFSANEFYYPKDIIEVVQISDLDGTFVPDSNCRPYDENHWNEECRFIYDPPYIYADNYQKIIDRNSRKSANLQFLITQKSIKVRSKTVPYSIYFFSSNIDHYLHNRLGLSGREKNDLAAAFADDCMADFGVFKRAVWTGQNTIQALDYEASWTFIMSGTNSLMRFTNFNLLLDSLNRKIQAEI